MTEPVQAADPRLDMDLPVAMAVPAKTLGGQLSAARHAHGVSLADISARTRIPERTLAAIEADAYEQLPHPTFAAGFVRSFAREVGVSESEATLRYRAENTRLPTPPTVPPLRAIEPDRVPSRQLAIGSGVTVVLVLIGGVLWYSRDRSAAPPPAPIAVASTTTTAPVASALVPSAPAAVGGGPSATVIPPAAASSGPAPASSAATPPMPPAALGTPGGAVTLTATQDAWLQIRDKATGQRVISTVLAQGQVYNVPPGAMELWTGRAGALQVRVNGRLLPPLGGAVETVRKLDLSPTALSARLAATPVAAAPAAR